MRTGVKWWSYADPQTTGEIFRNHTPLLKAIPEPGITRQCDHSELAACLGTFQKLSGVDLSTAGSSLPYDIESAYDLHFHLQVHLRVKGLINQIILSYLTNKFNTILKNNSIRAPT